MTDNRLDTLCGGRTAADCRSAVNTHISAPPAGFRLATNNELDERQCRPRRNRRARFRRRSPLLVTGLGGASAAVAALLLVICAALLLTSPVCAEDSWLNLPEGITKVPTISPKPTPWSVNFTPRPKPTPEPTHKPTFSPTHKPTMAPTDKPTENPTKTPTEKPTDSPTRRPTRKPTDSPTGAPSPEPTDSPTPKPTRKPTRKPSSTPTLNPSASPTRKPTDGPTRSPTRNPTDSPTSVPTPDPTPRPSREPTDGPTREPTPRPTERPTPRPTDGPTLTPTISHMPTISPSALPSELPSGIPSSHPSQHPSHAPSPSPSASPSAAPSLPEQRYEIEIVAEFDNVPRQLTGSSQILLEEVTEKHVRTTILETTRAEEVEFFDYRLRANFRRQARLEPPPEEGQRAASGSGNTRGRVLRSLQDEDTLLVTMDIYTSFKSTKSYDQEGMNELVGDAFNSDEDRAKYIKSLKSTGDSVFTSINSVLVTINGIPQVEPDQIARQTNQEGTSMWLIIGPVIGGVCVLIVLFVLIFTRHNAAKNLASSQGSPTLPETDGRVSTTIQVEKSPGDDVSTLGDPIFSGGAMGGAMLTAPIEKDETVAAESSADYDYARFYGGAVEGPSVTTGSAAKSKQGQSASEVEGDQSQVTSGRFTTTSSSNITDTVISKLEQPSLFSDDASFERQYNELEDRIEVVAPAGKLGVVIDTPHGGVPVVHAIKDTSVLADKIKVGDRLIYVDDEDTTRMTAIEVSRLISKKAHNPERNLIFVRYRSTEE